MKRVYVNVETLDGTIHEGLRLLAIDRIRAHRTARMTGIEWEESPVCQALVTHAAAQRLGLPNTEDFDTWMNTVADFEMTNDAPEGAHAVDPTQPPQEVPSMP